MRERDGSISTAGKTLGLPYEISRRDGRFWMPLAVISSAANVVSGVEKSRIVRPARDFRETLTGTSDSEIGAWGGERIGSESMIEINENRVIREC